MNKLPNLLSGAGALLTLAGAMLQITQWPFSPYIYLVGALLFGYVQVMHGYHGKNLIIRRLRRQQIISATLLVVAGILMLTTVQNEWILCMTIAAILQLYTAFRIPQELAKEK